MSSPRHLASQLNTALDILTDLEAHVAQGHPADSRLSSRFRLEKKYGSRDRRFLSDLAFAWFRWRGWFHPPQLTPRNFALAYLLSAASPPPPPTHSPRASPPPLPPFPLRQKASLLAALASRSSPPDPPQLFPSWFPASLPSHIDPLSLYASLQIRPPTWIRATRSDLLPRLQDLGIPATQHPRLPFAYSLPPTQHLPTLQKTLGTPLEPHDIASQAVAHICHPQPGQRWWDACAGSGGKSLHLGHLMQGRGHIDATDLRPTALDQFRRRLNRPGLPTWTATQADARSTPPPSPPYQGILIDAPCTGTGTWSRSPDARWRTTSRDLDQRVQDQRLLLDHAVRHLAPGGVLVYAVCSVTEPETFHQVHDISLRHPSMRLSPFPDPLTGASCPATRLILPHEGPGDGMFIARWIHAP